MRRRSIYLGRDGLQPPVTDCTLKALKIQLATIKVQKVKSLSSFIGSSKLLMPR
jgi:hypothetical protein